MRPDERWYPVPPYRNEGWKLLDDRGELVAVFECREHCEVAAELFNEHQERQS